MKSFLFAFIGDEIIKCECVNGQHEAYSGHP